MVLVSRNKIERDVVVVKSNVLLVFLLLTGNIYCQSNFKGYLTSSVGYESNPFITPSADPTYFSRNSLGIGYFPDSLPFAASYTVGITSLFEYPENNYHLHKVKADYSLYPFNTDNFEIIISANARMRLNASESELYDFFELNPEFAINYSTNVGNFSMDYSPVVNKFLNYDDLSNLQNELTISYEVDVFDNSNLYLSALYGNKRYMDNATKVTSPNPHNPNKPVTNGKGKQYMRAGKNQNNYEQPNIVYNSLTSQIIDINTGFETLVFDFMKIAIDVNANFHPFDDGLYFSSGATDVFGDIGFFDDIYNFDEKAVLLSSGIELTESLSFDLSYRYYSRMFQYSLGLINPDYSFDTHREDNGSAVRLNLKYNPTRLENFSFSIGASRIENSSNLQEYRFESTGVQFSASYGF